MSRAAAGPRLADAPKTYDQRNEQEFRNELERRDDKNYKKDRHIDLNPSTRIIMTSPNGTRYGVTVSNAGALVVTAE